MGHASSRTIIKANMRPTFRPRRGRLGRADGLGGGGLGGSYSGPGTETAYSGGVGVGSTGRRPLAGAYEGGSRAGMTRVRGGWSPTGHAVEPSGRRRVTTCGRLLGESTDINAIRSERMSSQLV